MKIRKTLSALVATGIVFGSAASAATPIAPVRQPAATQDKEGLGGVSVIGWIIAAAVAAGVILVIVNDDNNSPVSP